MLNKVNIIDNTGALSGRVIRILNKKSSLTVGSMVLVAIEANISNSKIKKGQVHKGIVVNDSCNKFSHSINSERQIILIKTKNNDILPIGSRVKGFISSNLRNVEGTERIFAICKNII